MANPFDDTQAIPDSNPFAETQDPNFKPKTKLGDIGRSLKSGVEQIPGMVTGLADIAPALAFNARPFTKAADALGDLTGFTPGKWAKDTEYSDGYKQSQQEVSDAWKGSESVLADPKTSKLDYAKKLLSDAPDIAGAYLKNPLYTANQVVESVPAMIAGGVASKGMMAAGRVAGAGESMLPGYLEKSAGEWAAPIAGGVGEGLTQAGSAMDQSEGPDQRKNALAALASGAGDALIAVGAGHLANKAGFETANTAMAKAGDGTMGTGMALGKRLAGGALTEGLMQEFPQSAQEQIWQNYADGKPLFQGVAQAAIEGALSGAVMGGGANVVGGNLRETPAPVAPPVQPGQPPAGPIEAAPTSSITGNSAADMLSGQIGTGGFAGMSNPLQASMPQAPLPSEQLGIDADAGPLSKVAAAAVDTGIHQDIHQSEATADDQAAYEAHMQDWEHRLHAELSAQDTSTQAITKGPVAEAQMSPEDKHAVLFSNQAVADGGQKFEGTQDGDILNGVGAPFATRMAAARRANMEGGGWTIAPVFDGFVARRKDAFKDQNGATDGVSPTGPTSVRNDGDNSAGSVATGAAPVSRVADVAGDTPDSVGATGDSITQGNEGAVSNIVDLTARLDARAKDAATEKAVRQELTSQMEELRALGNQNRVTLGDLATLKDITEQNDNAYNASHQVHKLLVAIKKRPAVDIQTEAPANVQNTTPAANDTQAAQANPAPQEVGATANAPEPVPGAGSATVEASGVGPASLGSAKADMDHLFGTNEKRTKAIARIAKGTAYFSTNMKAAQFITANGLKDTHTVAKHASGANRFDVIAKTISQPTENANGTQAPQAQQTEAQRQEAPSATKPVEGEAQQDWTRTRDVDRMALLLKAGLPQVSADRLKFKSWDNLAPRVQEKLTNAMLFVGEVAPAIEPAPSAAQYQMRHVGAKAFTDGAKRVPPAYMAASSAKEWLAGWDQANAVAPVSDVKAQDGQKDELDTEMQSYEAKPNPTYSGKPAIQVDKAEMRPYRKADGSVGYEAIPIAEAETKQPTAPVEQAPAATKTVAAEALNEREKAAKAKMFGALGKLAALASKNTRMNWTPEEEQQLLPIIIELFDGAMELGAVSFQKAVAYVRDFIKNGIDQETADAIPFDTLQGAYIAVAGRHKDKAVTPKKEVAGFDSLDELKEPEVVPDTAVSADARAQAKVSGAEEAAKWTGWAGKTVATAKVQTAILDSLATAYPDGEGLVNLSKTIMDEIAADQVSKPVKQPLLKNTTEKNLLHVALAGEILKNNMPKDNPALKKLVEAFDGKPADQSRMKEAQEALESAIVIVSRGIVAKNEGVRSTFDVLLRLYQSQPNLNIRTSTSIANQAYSTPAPLAYLGSVLADVTQKTSLYEPTGGNGMLTINALPSNVTVNELEHGRIASLKTQGFAEVLEGDALKADVAPKSQDRVMTNPPFGSVKNDKGEPIKVSVDGYKIGQIDHLIAARALETMKDDGKATLIIGANKVTGGLNTDDRIFFNWLYGNYNVTSHFELDGDLYNRQGAGWPVRVITVHGRQKSDRVSPVAGTIQRAQNWEQVYEHFTASLDSSRTEPIKSASTSAGGTSAIQAGLQPVREPVGKPSAATGGLGQEGSSVSAGNVAGPVAGNDADSSTRVSGQLGGSDSPQRLNAESVESDRLDPSGDTVIKAPIKPAGNTGATALSSAENQFQVTYVPRSSRKDGGVLIPVNMKDPTQDALSRLEDAVGNIDDYLKKQLGYDSVEKLHDSLMGLQVDSVASAIYQIEQGKGVIIADQTGIGKGRQAAAIIRWAERSGYIPVFVSVKPSLFTDMFGDLHDIGSDEVRPFILNKDESIKGQGGEKLFANKAIGHKRTIERIRDDAVLPDNLNSIFMTYSQVNTDNVQRQMLIAIADKAVFILDESHNAGGQSNTGTFITSLLEGAKGVTYLSATYAKRPDNMPLYFKTDIGQAIADNEGLMDAMARGGLPLQTVVSNNLVKAGQMFRRERSYDGVSIETIADTEHRVEHEALSDETTKALRAIVSADRMFHHVFVKQMKEEMAQSGGAVMDNAGNQAQAGVDHTQFSSVVHNFVKQMLLGLKAQRAADDAIAALKRNEKPIIAVENTMGSFLEAYAKDNAVSQGGSLGTFDYRTVLSRALARTLFVTEVKPNGEKEKREIKLSQLDPETRAAYDNAQNVIDGLKLDIPVSPIDWMRNEIRKAGFTVAEITGRKLAVDYSTPGKAVLGSIDSLEQTDKVRTTQMFNSGRTDALVLNVAGSTGISIHASEKFEDQRQRHMIIGQAASDINIFMQMLGRIHRTGQVVLPKYTILSVDLPTEKRPTAVLSGKMKSLNANTSSNTDSATSIKTVDMFNKYGDQVVASYLRDNYKLARDLDVEDLIGGDDTTEDLAQKVTGRLALQPIAVQNSFYEDVEGQYSTMMEYLNKTNQNDLEPRTFDYDAQETRSDVLFEGPNKDSPFGEDAIYGEYSIKAQGKAMTPAEIREAIQENLGGKNSDMHMRSILAPLVQQFNEYVATLDGPTRDSANAARAAGQSFMVNHSIGDTFRVDINGESFNAVVTNIRNTHKTNGNSFSLSKIQVTIALNGALRSISVPASQFQKIEVSSIGRGYTVEQLFKEQPANQRETAKIVTGNLLAAYGELQGVRGTIISFTKKDGTTEQGILLPKAFDFARNTRGDYRLTTAEDALNFLQKSENKDIGRFGIQSRDGIVRVLPAGRGISVMVPKSKLKGGKFFLDAGLIGSLGDFVTSGSSMKATTYSADDAIKAIDLLMKKNALYAIPSMAEEAKALSAPDSAAFSRPAFSRGAKSQANESVTRLATGIASYWENAPKLVIAFDMSDPLIPESVRKEDQRQRSGGATGTPEGFYYKGTTYLMSSRLNTPNDIARVMFHESLGHHGLRGLFGKSLQPILRDITVLRKADVEAKMVQYGLKGIDKMDRMTAAEEVLAELAQTKPESGFVMRAIAAIRTWLRENVPGFKSLELSDAELIRNYILPARQWVENGGDGPKGGVRIEPTFSRSMPEVIANAANSVRELALPAGYQVNDFIGKTPGTINWWNKTIGTQYDLAQKSPAFKKVFDHVQNFINDVSYFATEAADLAPNILPKLESWKDIGRAALSPEDTKAVSTPVFEGTLSWGRDETGRAVSSSYLESQAAALTVDQKATQLLKRSFVDDKLLRMWQGLPLDQYEAIINGKYEREMLKPGVVFSPSELKSIFKLTGEKQSDGTWSGQIGLYHEFRKSTDKSLTNLAISDMLRFAGKDVEPIRDAVMDSKTPMEGAEAIRDYLLSQVDLEPERADVLRDTANKVIDKGTKAHDLMERGYAPLSRFGKYTLDILDEAGERIYFGMFESPSDASKMKRQMLRDHPAATFNEGTVSEEAYKMFAGVSPETLELFGDMLGLEAQGDSESAQAFQTYLKLARSSRSSMTRLIQRKGIAGFSEDAGRVLAGFVYSNARQTSSNLHMGSMTTSANDVAQTQGELKDQAVKLVDYIKNPQEEAQALRGLMFAQLIGGSVASAMVNLTQPITMTFPWLSQFGGTTSAAKQMGAAMKDALKRKTGDTALDAALHKAEEDGTVSPQEVHQLMQQAQGQGALRSGDGTRAGNMMATSSNVVSRIMLGWGKLFSTAEQFNRRVTYIAAYRTAVEQKMADPDGFARKAIQETQGIYNKGNKPVWARGAVGGVLFTFKQYSISYVEMLTRMGRSSPEGKKAALLALGVLFLMSGMGGMPGGDDLDDIISGAMQALGYNFDSKTKRHEFFANLLGEGGAQFMERGVSGLPGVPIDVSGRMGLGNLIPGTGLLTKKADHTSDVAELAGPVGDLAKRGFQAAGQIVGGDVMGAAETVSPLAIRNLTKAYDMANMGMYRDQSGKKVIDTDATDAIFKGIGFQPNDVKRVQDATGEVQRMIGLNKLRETAIADEWAKGIFEKDPGKVQAARDDMKQWNSDNPDSHINIKFNQIIKRVQQMNMTKEQRIIKTAPAEIRKTVRDELAAAK